MNRPELRTPALWGHVHALTVLAETGSFTAAAQRLGWSKAAMSQRVAELEQAAGVPLVQRSTRSVQLTDAGRQLADAARAPFAAIDQAFTGVRELAGEPAGRLRVTAPVALARQTIVPLLPGFLRAHPRVRLELDLSDRLRSLAQEGFDLAVRHTASPPDTHVAWRLCETHSVLVASPDYLGRRGTPRHPTDLSQHDCLHYLRPGDQPAWSFAPWPSSTAAPTAGAGEQRLSVAIQGPLAANNSEVLREAAIAGLGVALLPDFSARAALDAGALRPVLPEWQAVGAFGEAIWAVRPHGALVPGPVRALVSWLRQHLGPVDTDSARSERTKKTT